MTEQGRACDPPGTPLPRYHFFDIGGATECRCGVMLIRSYVEDGKTWFMVADAAGHARQQAEIDGKAWLGRG